MMAQQEILVQLLRAGSFERPYLAALRIYPLEDAANRAVLATGIRGLQHNQQALAMLRIESLLERRDALALRCELVLDVFLALVMLGLVRIDFHQPYVLARL